MILNRIGNAIKRQDWFVVFIELVIVVVGIYIGLQVDDWQKEQEAKAITQSYYERLMDDLESERATNHIRLEYIRVVQNFGYRALEVLTTPGAEKDEQFLIDVYQAAQLWPYEPQRSTYDELVSGGIANAIPDIQLRTRLANFYNAYGSLEFSLQERTLYRERIRAKLPPGLQKMIAQNCGDVLTSSDDFLINSSLPAACSFEMDQALIDAALIRLQTYTEMQDDLTRQITDLETKLFLLEWNLTLLDQMMVYLEEAKE